MSMSRRKLLLTSLGASQLYLLSRFDLLRSTARATPDGDHPTKLVTILVSGGIHNELVWCPFYDDRIGTHIPQPPNDRCFYDRSMVANMDGSGAADADADIRRLRAPVTWNPASPADNGFVGGTSPVHGGPYDPKGYVWASPEHRLYENVALLHGVDQGTAAHDSGRVAAMCGVAGGNFTVPSIPAVVANHFSRAFPDRVLPSVSIGGQIAAPAVTLPSAFNPAGVSSITDVQALLSDRRGNWEGLRTRREVGGLAFDGAPTDARSLTRIDEAVMGATRALRGRSSAGADAMLEQLHDSYGGVSQTIARDIVDILERTPGVEHLPPTMSWAPGESRFGWRIGYADAVASDSTWSTEFDLALRLLKSDLTSCVTFKGNGQSLFNFDSHYANPFPVHSQHVRGHFESIGRFIAELKLTPSPSRPGRTLLDETLVYITSDFGRSFPSTGGSDHNPMTSAFFASGAIQGNRMVGGYRESPFGIPVTLRDGRETVTRPPRAQDVAATVYACLGLEAGPDYFIPGENGVVEGIPL